MIAALLLSLALGYLLGSIPFGLLLTRAAGLGDIRKVGSGNIGATNVLRTGNKALAAAKASWKRPKSRCTGLNECAELPARPLGVIGGTLYPWGVPPNPTYKETHCVNIQPSGNENLFQARRHADQRHVGEHFGR